MAKYKAEDIRNIGIIAHQGAGKTSMSEALLFTTKAVNRLGSVDGKTSVFDFEPEEQKRAMTINSAFGHCQWNRHQLNIIDTPGEFNFLTDTRNSLLAVDTAIAVVSATDGVEVGTEKVWAVAKELELPRIVFINKMDRERASFSDVLQQIQENLSSKAIPIQIPLGEADAFRGVVSLLDNKVYEFNLDGSGEFKEISMEQLPDEIAAQVETARDALIESIAETDDQLIEKYLEDGELTDEELQLGLKKGIQQRNFFPVLCGSASKNAGLSLLLDLIVESTPSPVDKPPMKGLNSDGEAIQRNQNEDEPFSALVFKTVIDPYSGKLSVFRVISGSLHSDSTVMNVNKKSKERIGQILRLTGKKQEAVDDVITGDIVAVAKLKDTQTGDTLCDEKSTFRMEAIKIPSPIISFALKPRSKGDEDKVATALHRLMEEDITLRVTRDEWSNDMLLSGMGHIHIETAIDKMKRKFNVDVDLAPPKVPYKETIMGTASAEGKHKKQTGGRGQFGIAWLKLEPATRGQGFEFVDAIVGGVIPRQYIPAVEKGVVERMAKGAIAGFPVIDVKVTCFDGKYHDVDSSEMAFKIAASKGFQSAFKDAKPIILEPIMDMEITVPEEQMGDVIGDINARRGKVLGMDSRAKKSIIKAQVPMAKVLKYAPDLRSITSGKGSFTISFSHNQMLPHEEAEKLIAAYKGEEEDEG